MSQCPLWRSSKMPKKSIKYRKSALTVMGQHFGQIGAMANGRVPFDAQKAKDDAALVRSLSQLPWAAFGPGTDMGETKAKPEIWKEQAKFKAAADTAMGELSKLDAAAKTGNHRPNQSGIRRRSAKLQGLPRRLPGQVRPSGARQQSVDQLVQRHKVGLPHVTFDDAALAVNDEGGGCEFDVAPNLRNVTAVVQGHLEWQLARLGRNSRPKLVGRSSWPRPPFRSPGL